jgi:hypothetical protein
VGRKRHRSWSWRLPSRYDRRFYLAGALVLVAAIVAKLLGADDFHAYPTIQLGFDPATVALSALLVVAGFAPLRRKPKRRAPVPDVRPVMSPPRGPGAAPRPKDIGTTLRRGPGASPSLGATGV